MDTQASFPAPNAGINTTVGIEITGIRVTRGIGPFEFDLTMLFGETTSLTVQAVDLAGTVQENVMITARSANGYFPPDDSTVTAFPSPNGGGETYARRPTSTSTYAPGVYPSTDVCSVTESAPFVLMANNIGQTPVEFTAVGGRTGRVNVTVVNLEQQ